MRTLLLLSTSDLDPPPSLPPHSLHHVKRPGAILHPGTVVANIDLDDPSKVQTAEKFTGPLPLPRNRGHKHRGDKIHQVGHGSVWSHKACDDVPRPLPMQLFQAAQESLRCIMAGLGVQGEPYFSAALNNAVSSLLLALKDPALPLMELQVSEWEREGGREGGRGSPS